MEFGSLDGGAFNPFPKLKALPEPTPPRKAPAPPCALGQVGASLAQRVAQGAGRRLGTCRLAFPPNPGALATSPDPRSGPLEERVAPTVELGGAASGGVGARRPDERKPSRRGWAASVPGSGVAAAAPQAQLPRLPRTSWARLLRGGLPKSPASDPWVGWSLSTSCPQSPA